MNGSRNLILGSLLALGLASAIGCGPAAVEPAGGSGQAARTPERDVLVAAGTIVRVELDRPISSDSSDPGDRFAAKVVEPVYVDDAVAIKPGSMIHGKVVDVQRGKKIGGRAQLTLEFTELELPDGEQVPIDATLHSEGKSQAGKDAATIGGSAAGGAVLGRIIGHQKDKANEGTAIGAVVGAAIGTAVAASTEGQPVTLPAGTTLSIHLDSPVRIMV